MSQRPDSLLRTYPIHCSWPRSTTSLYLFLKLIRIGPDRNTGFSAAAPGWFIQKGNSSKEAPLGTPFVPQTKLYADRKLTRQIGFNRSSTWDFNWTWRHLAHCATFWATSLSNQDYWLTRRYSSPKPPGRGHLREGSPVSVFWRRAYLSHEHQSTNDYQSRSFLLYDGVISLTRRSLLFVGFRFWPEVVPLLREFRRLRVKTMVIAAGFCAETFRFSFGRLSVRWIIHIQFWTIRQCVDKVGMRLYSGGLVSTWTVRLLQFPCKQWKNPLCISKMSRLAPWTSTKSIESSTVYLRLVLHWKKFAMWASSVLPVTSFQKRSNLIC